MKKYNAEEWKTKQEEAKEKLKAQVADIVTNFENAPEDILEFLHFSSRFYQYSTNNKMLIYKQNPGARFCASYNKLKEMGYQVQRGQKGMEILVPAAVTYWYDDKISQWKRLSEAKKEEKAKIKAGEIETKKITVFKIGHTFDIGQTDCPVAEYPKLFGMGYSSEKHDELFNAVKSYCEERGIPVYIENFPSISMRGYFQPADNTIHLSDKLNDSMKLSVLTHELGHAVMHAAYDPDMSVEQKEIEADSLSLMLREHLGVSEIENARKAHLADSYRNYLEYKELNSDRIKCPELPEILDRVNTAYGDMITGFNGAIESYLHREKEEVKELNPTLTAESNKKIANEAVHSIGLQLPIDDLPIDYNKSINRSLQNVNAELTKLVAAYEEAYNIPSDERLTVYSGDYMIYETAEHASTEKFNSAVSTALEKLGLSDTEFEAADYSKKQLVGFFKKIIENEKENEQFKSDLIKWQNGDYPATEMLKVSSTPYVMQACGIEAHDIYIKQNTLKKVMSNNKEEFPHAHNVSMKELYQIPNIIRNPVMILKGEHPNAVIFVSNMFDSDNHRIIIPCTLNIDVKRYTAHRIMSIYGKNHLNNYLKNKINKGAVLAYNKKIASEMIQSIGHPLPKEESLIDYDNSICYSPRNVNTEKEKIKLLNPSAEQISLVAAYEEAYDVPSDERLTVYSGDYMLYETAEHASTEKFNSAVSTALKKLSLSKTEFEAADYSKKQLVEFFKKIIENEKENEQFKSDLIKWQNGEYPATEVIKVCSTPYVMQACGIEAHDIVIKNNTLRKITSDDKEEFHHAHSMSIEELYKIPDVIRNPVMLIKGRHPNSIVFISNEFDSNGKRIIMPCTLNVGGKNCSVHRIMSVYGKEHFENFIKNEISNNSILAYNKKIANEITRSIGRPLPKEESLIDYNDSICYSPRNVNTEKEKIKLLNPTAEQVSLVAAYEEAYNIPSDERLTVYSGDYMIYETAEHASTEKFNSAVSTALEKLGLSDTEFEAADYSKKQLVGFFKKIIENEKENEQFKSDLIKWQNGDYPATEVIKVCSTPYVMQACGIEAHDIVIKNNTLRKITSDDKEKFIHAHNMSIGELYQIPNAIRNPVMILKGNHPNSIIFVSNIYDSNNNRIIIPCTLNFDLKHYTAQRIMSIYGKEKFEKYIKKEFEKKSLMAYNKKIANEMIQSIGLYLPKEESLIDYDNSICYSPRNVNTEKEKRLIKDLKQMILRDETSPEAVLSDRSAQNWYSFTCQASGTDDIKNSLKRLVTDEMKIVAVQDFDAGSKTVQLTPDFQLQFIGTGYSNHREALSAVLGDSSVAKIVEYDTLKNAAENHDFKIISEAENIKYPYVIFENSNSEIRRMPFRNALKELEEKNNVAVEKQSYEAVDISIVADRDNVYSMQAELGTPRSVTEQIQAYCDDLKLDGLGREAALQKYINNNHAAEMNFSARDQIMFDGFDIGR